MNEKIVLNRETEKIVFPPPMYIHFHLKPSCDAGVISFNIPATRLMKLKKGEYIEFELEGIDWYVRRSDNKETGYKMSQAGKQEAVMISSNKLVRGFLAMQKIRDRTWIKCSLEKDEKSGFDNYPRYKIIPLKDYKAKSPSDEKKFSFNGK